METGREIDSVVVDPSWLGHGQEKTVEGWLDAVIFDADLDFFGGYSGDQRWFDEVVVVNFPGNESTKYAETLYFDREKVEAAFRKYAPLSREDDVTGVDGFEALWDAQLSADQVLVIKTRPQEA